MTAAEGCLPKTETLLGLTNSALSQLIYAVTHE
jgi:hypothetical protein